MDRIPEPELMDDPAQARAYDEADFAEAHDRFVALFDFYHPGAAEGARVADLGCGSADVTVRFAHAHPDCRIDGFDAAEAMLERGRRAVASQGLERRIRLLRRRLPLTTLPDTAYDAVISNSLLHHLHDPQVLWNTVRHLGHPGAPVLVMDLVRPQNRERAAALVKKYAGQASDLLKRDFFNSLLAAFRVEEVREQLRQAGLEQLQAGAVGDRHLVVHGRIPERAQAPVGV